MYSENHRRASAYRADEEFLRRLSGGVIGMPPSPQPPTSEMLEPSCPNRCARAEDVSPLPCDSLAPSLAMVYSPRQCWRGLLNPAAGLSAGTIFSELVLPLESAPNATVKEVRCSRPM